MNYNPDALKDWAVSKGKITKQDVCIHLGLKCNSSGERTARRILAEIAATCPVISLSSEEGYEIIPEVKTETDAYKLSRQITENISRANKILKRNAPLREALKEGNYDGDICHL